MKMLQQNKKYKIIEDSMEYYENKKEIAIIFSKIEQNLDYSIYYGLTKAGKFLTFIFINDIKCFENFSYYEKLCSIYNYGGIILFIINKKEKFYKIPFSLDFFKQNLNLFFKKENEIFCKDNLLFFLEDDIYKYTKIYKTK